MKNEKYVISDIMSFYYLSDTKKKCCLRKETNFRNILKYFSNEVSTYNREKFLGSNIYNYSRENIVYFVTHPIVVQVYESSEYVTLVEEKQFKISTQGSYDKDTGLVLIETDEKHLYVASADEIEFFSIPVLCYKNCHYFILFELMKYSKNIWSEKLDTIFNASDLDSDYMFSYIPLVGTLREFILPG